MMMAFHPLKFRSTGGKEKEIEKERNIEKKKNQSRSYNATTQRKTQIEAEWEMRTLKDRKSLY